MLDFFNYLGIIQLTFYFCQLRTKIMLNTKSRDGKEFRQWVQSMIDDLNEHSINVHNKDYDYHNLKPYHYNKLWRIYDEYINIYFGGAKEELMNSEIADTLGQEVILESYGESRFDFERDIEIQRLMDKND